MPWPLLVYWAHSSKSSPANNLGQDPLLTAALGNCLCSLSWFGDQQANVLARGCSTQKAVWNNAPTCQVRKSNQGKDVWSDPTICHLCQHAPSIKSFPLKGWYKLQCSSVQVGRWVSYPGHCSSGVITERVGQNTEWDTFFLLSSSTVLLRVGYFFKHVYT